MSVPRTEQRPRSAAASLVALAITASQPVFAAEGPRVEVRESPEGPAVESVELIVPATDTTAKRQLFLIQAGEDPIENLRLVVVIEGLASVTATPLGGAAGDPVTVPAGGLPVLITLEATMTRAGTASGELRVGPELESVARLRVEKSLPAALTVQGATDTSGLTLATQSPTFRQSVYIVSHVVGPTKVRLVPSLFTGPTGTQTASTLEYGGVVAGGPVDVEVPGLGSIPVTVSFATPVAGDYRGELTLIIDGQRKSVPIMVNRSRVDPTVAFESLVQRRATIAPLRPKPIEARFAIRETSGAATSLHDLTAELVKVVDPAVEVQTDIGPAPILEGTDPAANPLVFASGERKGLVIHVDKLWWPGHYRAKLRASSAHGGTVEATLDLLVRFPLWVALGVILVAVLVSHFLRTSSTTRTRLIVQQRIASYRERLEAFAQAVAPTNDIESRLLKLLDRHLEEYYLRTLAVPPVDPAVELAMIELKLNRILRRWLDARRRADRAEARDPLLQELSKVEDFLGQRVPTGAKTVEQAETESQEHENTLRDVEKKLDAELAPPKAGAPVGADGPETPAIEVPSSAELERRLRKLELATTLVVLVAAALFGVHLLYSPDATWGSAGDFIVAILWGLGLHAVGGQTFGGAGWIRQQFGLPAS